MRFNGDPFACQGEKRRPKKKKKKKKRRKGFIFRTFMGRFSDDTMTLKGLNLNDAGDGDGRVFIQRYSFFPFSTIYFINPSGKLKLSFDRTTKSISQIMNHTHMSYTYAPFLSTCIH